MEENTPPLRLTGFSHGSGCGCKIAPSRLEKILAGSTATLSENLLVGNSSNDDAAVFALDETTALISTTDFFMPIVDDPYAFGRIAAVNAISDVYAMGGKPILALAILGWPVDKLSEEIAAQVMQGGRDACAEAGIPLAGGHSIDNLEPLFGLAVNGMVPRKNLKRNDTGCAGDLLYLTKPLGTGIIATAIKRQKASEEHIALVTKTMGTLNKIGAEFGSIPAIHAMTDVTGFGLAGHLLEMCKGANLSAELWFDAVPTLPREVLQPYIDAFILPDNTFRNYQSYNQDITALSGAQLPILCDPQTSGGLLIAVDPAFLSEIEALLKQNNLPFSPIGKLTEKQEKRIVVV